MLISYVHMSIYGYLAANNKWEITPITNITNIFAFPIRFYNYTF